jgi:hypothetical protein
MIAVVNRVDDEVYTNLFTSTEKAEQAVAEFIRRERKDECKEMGLDIAKLMKAKRYGDVVTAWNDANRQQGYADEFIFETKKVDEPI